MTPLAHLQQNPWLNGWYVKLPDGRGAHFFHNILIEVWGGAETYRASLEMMRDAGFEMVVRGGEEHVLAAMMFEPILSIEIITELQERIWTATPWRL